MPAKPTLEQLKTLAASNPDSFRVQMQLAQALHEAGDGAGAIEALERASKLVPKRDGQANPNALIALIATEQGDTARAIRALEAVVKSITPTSKRRASWRRCSSRLATRRAPPPRTRWSRSSIRSTRRRRRYVGRFALQRGRQPIAPFARSVRRSPPNPSDRAGAHIDLGRGELHGRADGRCETPGAGGARDRARRSSAHRTCCSRSWTRNQPRAEAVR